MWTDAPPSVYLYVVALGIILLTSLSLSTIGKKHYPPGPKALPIIGNILSIPQDAAWKVYAEWSQKFGDIIYLRVFRSHIIVINSVSIARELLENRGAIYSSRPWVPMAGDVMELVVATPPLRRDVQTSQEIHPTILLPKPSPPVLRFPEEEAYRLINDVLDAPENYKEHVQRMAGAVVMALVYGHDARKHDDWLLQIASKGARTIESVGPVGAHLVDLIPILRFIPDWFPGAGFKRLPPGTREALSDMRFVPYNYVKEKMAMGTAVDCYVTELLEMTKSQDEEGVRDTAANNYSAGSDTTTALLISAILALTVNPIIQARLQAELDTVVGKDRLPDFSDKDNLPYLQCVISEAIRWGAVTPIGVPHTSVQDDVYDGMYIPKGTTIIANAWAMLHDPQTYPEPESFNPDRFLTGEGRTPPPDPRTPLFGFGRRQCPGKDTSGNTIFIALATLFHVFKFSPMTDEEGNPIPIDVNPFEHSVRHPKPFLCKIRPRRPESISLIRSVQDF